MRRSSVRLRFLDAARCLAIVLMVLAHVRDGLMSPDWSSHTLARLHDLTRGFTAPLFFIVSGWAFAAATLPRWRAFQQWGPPLRRRLERIALLFVIGKLLTLPWWHEGFPFAVPSEVWLPNTMSGVLECLAVAMLIAHLVVYFAPNRGLLVAVPLVLAFAAVFLGPALQELSAPWPLLVRGVFNSDGGTGGGFALAPCGGYFWLGAAGGGLWALRGWHGWRGALGIGAVGAALLALSPLVHLAGPRAWAASPSLFFMRTGVTLLLLAVLAAAHEVVRAPAFVERLAPRALTFYVGHMLMLWGVPFVAGLVWRIQHGLDPADVLLVTVAMLAVLSVFCFLTEREAPAAQTEGARS